MPIKKLTGTLLYIQVQKPVACFEKSKGSEWKASICVDEDTADAWAEDYPKQSATVIKTSEFEAKYKVPAPYPDAKKQYVITLRKNTKLGNGNDVPDLYKPKVMVPDGSSYKDVTQEVLPANGSKGSLSVDVWEMDKGNVARLKNILVTEMIEYEGSSGAEYTPGDEFGSGASAKAPAKAEKPVAKKKVVVKQEEVEEDDVPF
jgi:hypothetical protein